MTMQPAMKMPSPGHPTGYDLLRNPRLNKGTAFTEAERCAWGLEGLLPPAVTTLALQVARRHAEIADLDESAGLDRSFDDLALRINRAVLELRQAISPPRTPIPSHPPLVDG